MMLSRAATATSLAAEGWMSASAAATGWEAEYIAAARAEKVGGQRGGGGSGAQAAPTQTIEERTVDLQRMDGFMPLYWDADSGRLFMEIGRWNEEILTLAGLATGLGSNDIGLDRGISQGSQVVYFEKVGPKIFMVEPNYRFRSSSSNPEEVKAVTDAFAPAILWAWTPEAQTGDRVLVDMTPFLLTDHNGVGNRMGGYRVEASRSAVYMPMTMNFPQNTEMEVTLTFVPSGGGGGGGGGRGGRGGGNFFEGVGSVAASSSAPVLRVHHAFVQLPDDNYEPRVYDPRSSLGGATYEDYSVPLGEPLEQRYIRRHRLEKVDPTAEVSDAVEPIIYYLDPGTPEPMRSALLEGAGWWNQAFEAAGYRNAFQVQLRPPDVSSNDIRYNVINWVHRSTRGWSTGGSVTDPRTGEIMKGLVTLGSLRVRQDYLIAEGLLAPYVNGDENPQVLADWALARLRQLGAHETGHTLGFAHNYYDSSQGRTSVMDYPHPLVTLNPDGTFDYSQVYDVGIGAWDKVGIAYGYQDFPDGTDEQEALQVILAEAWDQDLRFMTNQDITPSPRVNQWSNGMDPAAELNRMMEIRAVALSNFGERNIRRNAPLATMEEVLVPLYLYHRFQIIAAASSVGGVNYIYALRGDGRDAVSPAPRADQIAALDALLATVSPEALALPESVLDDLPPRPSGWGGSRELFPGYTGSTFDVIAPAVVASDLTMSELLDAQRAARLVQQHALDESLPGLEEVIERMIDATFGVTPANGYQAEISRAVERVVTDHLMSLAAGAAMSQVRAVSTQALVALHDTLESATGLSDADAAHYALLVRDIERFLSRPGDVYVQATIPNAPPGEPIGEPAMDYLGAYSGVDFLMGLEPYCSQDPLFYRQR
ncbi:MAG: zinc-dependent metalloprotease [Acidobacteriota bacterium]|jgi:hypothetical protein